MSPREHGYRVGYADYVPHKRPIPPAPHPLHTPERTDWITGWAQGRNQAERHHNELETEIRRFCE